MKQTIKSTLLAGSAALAMSHAYANGPDENPQNGTPNFIIIFIDDMGYGDIGCFGNELFRTPNLDKMAKEGMKLTDFYVSSSVCTPSRASLMTGCYPKRVDLHFDAQMRPVLFPGAMKGLNASEITIAEMLKTKGYTTACIGKWHLGDQQEFLPTKQGFDYFYGIPYSHDMFPREWSPNRPEVPLLRNETVIEQPVVPSSLTKRYTEETLKFIEENKDAPFFVYLPHSMPHYPVSASPEFVKGIKNLKEIGMYGTAIQELDWSTGQILDLLKELKLDKNTMVIFTSDNGADAHQGGSNKPLRGWKASSWEGGFRVPAICWWPETVPAGSTSKRVMTTMDLFPTMAQITGADLPEEPLDGVNVLEILKGNEEADIPRKYFAYYHKDQLHALRSGKWKMHVPTKTKYADMRGDSTYVFKGALYNLEEDIAEQNNVWEENPEVVEEMLQYADELRLEFGDQGMCSPHIRMAGYVDEPVFLELKK